MIHFVSRSLGRISLSALIVVLGAVSTLVAQVATPESETGEPPAEFGVETWTYAEEEDATEATSRFVFSSATAFVQYDSTNTWAYGGSGCIYKTGGSDFFDIDLQIPAGVELDFLRIYFNDTDAAFNARATLFSFDGAGGNTSIASAESSGTPGFDSAGSGFFSHIVENINESLVVRINFLGATTSALEICGVRLRYTAP